MPWSEFSRELRREWSEDRAGDLAAGLTFFGVLALFPFVLFLVSLASVLIEPADAERLVGELSQFTPPQATELIAARIRSLGEQSNVGLLTLGALGALWAASGGVTALIRVLNVAYDVEEQRPFWKVRLLALGATMVAAVLSLSAGLTAIAAPALADYLGGPLGLAITVLRLPVAGLVMMTLWAFLYWALPDVEQQFRFITPGSVVGVLIWVLASWLFSLYVQSFGEYEATYGALGGVIVLLMWMWISAQSLVLGAEINSIVEHRSPEGKSEGDKRLPEARAPMPRDEPPRPAAN